jgi:hypothetical protein
MTKMGDKSQSSKVKTELFFEMNLKDIPKTEINDET